MALLPRVGPPAPEGEPALEAAQLGSEGDQVGRHDLPAGGLLDAVGNRRLGGPDQAPLEMPELLIDLCPVAGVFWVGGIRILALEQAIRVDLGIGGPLFLRVLLADDCSLGRPR